MNPQFTGALGDTRAPIEKLEDVRFEEIVATANTVNWIEKDKDEWRLFPELNQEDSFMCGAFSMKKLMGVYYWLKYGTYLDFSEEHIYQRRFNKPDAGMAIQDIYRILGEGVTLKVLTNAVINKDADADGCVIENFKHDVGKVFRMGRPVYLSNNIEEIASVIQTTGKAVHYMTYFTSAEWSAFIPKVIDKKLNLYSPKALRHYVTIVDFFLYKGKKYLLVEDSSHFGGISRRLISEEWLAARTAIASYPMNFAFEEKKETLVFSASAFKQVLEFIPWDDKKNQPSNMELHESQKDDVKALQELLKVKGFFPANVACTGYYGATTATAVYNFQVSRRVASLSELDSIVPKGGRVGAKTLAQLNRE